MKIAFVLLNAILTLAFELHADTITLRADPWCPHTCDPGSGKNGIFIDISDAIFKEAGHTIDYQILNWARAIEQTRDGKYNAIVGAYQSDAPDFLYPKQPQGSTQNCFFVKPESLWTFQNTKNLTGQTIGIVNGYTYGEPLDSMIAQSLQNKRIGANAPQFEPVSGNDVLYMNFKKLLANRLTVVLEEKLVTQFGILSLPEFHGVKSVGCLKEQNTFIAFSPHQSLKEKSKKYSEILNVGMIKIKKNGILKAILKRYMN